MLFIHKKYINSSVDQILTKVKSNVKDLTKLIFRPNQINAQYAEELANALVYNTNVKVLKIWGSNLKDKDLIPLFQMLFINESIVTLSMGFTKMDVYGEEWLAKAIEYNSCLKYLDISGNDLRNSGMKKISIALSKNRSIKSLDFGKNKIGDIGIRWFSEMLKKNYSIEKVYLWRNEITDKGAELLAGGLKGNFSIKEIYLQNNKISYKGARSLFKILSDNKKINIHLYSNPTTNESETNIEQSLKI